MEQVAEEADSLKESLDRYFQRHQRRMQDVQERAELLGRAVCNFFFFFLCLGFKTIVVLSAVGTLHLFHIPTNDFALMF